MSKPEALWLANELPWVKHTADWVVCNLAAAELRRLHAQRDALLGALQELCDTLGECGMTEKARAAIKAVEENT